MPHDKPLKILLVDDEPLARSRQRELLADIAVQFATEVVGEAGNGLAALEFLRQHPVDVVLADKSDRADTPVAALLVPVSVELTHVLAIESFTPADYAGVRELPHLTTAERLYAHHALRC